MEEDMSIHLVFNAHYSKPSVVYSSFLNSNLSLQGRISQPGHFGHF